MEFLDNLVLPQSAHHMVLLKYLLVLTYIIFIPYVSLLFGSILLSLFFKKRGEKSGRADYYRFAKELVDQVTFNKGAAFAFGVVPLLSAAFCYAQLLHLTGLNVPEYLLISVLLLVIALVLIFTYKYSFHLQDLFDYALQSGSGAALAELEFYRTKTGALNKKSGLYGLIFLAASIYLFVVSVNLASDTASWQNSNNLFGVLFRFLGAIYFIQFVLASLAITAAMVLYRNFRNNSGIEKSDFSYFEMIKGFSLKTGLITTIILPAVIVLTIFGKPAETFSFDLFGAAIVVLFVLLFIAILFYVMIKESTVKFSTAILYLFVVVFALIIIKDQFAFDTATKKQFALLAANYEQYQKKLKEEFGLVVEAINGADIYNGKCIACHQFDRKLVGPPYNEVLPKYEGKKDELVKFILNPVKINPEYPAMPNQGLKPKEAEAVADYLISTFKK